MATSPASAYADVRGPRAVISSHDALVDDLDRSLRELVRREGSTPSGRRRWSVAWPRESYAATTSAP